MTAPGSDRRPSDSVVDLRDNPPIFGNGHANRWLLSLYNEAPIDEIRNRKGAVTRPHRPAAVRIVGPIEGSRTVTDPDLLRREARRLLAAADLLEAEQTPEVNLADDADDDQHVVAR